MNNIYKKYCEYKHNPFEYEYYGIKWQWVQDDWRKIFNIYDFERLMILKNSYITCYWDECPWCIHCEWAEYISDIAFYITDKIQNDENWIENMKEIIYEMLLKMLYPKKFTVEDNNI